MIGKTNIERNIRQLKNNYNKTASPRMELFYSKLAVIELCGWIEESMDDIVIKCSRRVLREHQNKKLIKENVVDKTYGFEYEKHFRKMLINVIGLVNVERLEKKLNPIELAQLKSTLGSLKGSRNSAAHTHIKGVAISIDAPSVTESNFEKIYRALKSIDIELRGSTI